MVGFHTFSLICCCFLVAKLCPTVCNAMDCSLPGSSVRGILQARILEWVAISFSRGFLLILIPEIPKSGRPGVVQLLSRCSNSL